MTITISQPFKFKIPVPSGYHSCRTTGLSRNWGSHSSGRGDSRLRRCYVTITGRYFSSATSWRSSFFLFGSYRPHFLFLGALPKLPQATVSFVVSVCLSVRMEQLGSHWTNFHDIWVFFRNSVEEILLRWHYSLIQYRRHVNTHFQTSYICWPPFPVLNFAFINLCFYTVPPGDNSGFSKIWQE